MTGLLVSVRSAAEARLALAGGADLIDVKEPLHGSLGATEPTVWAEVVSTVGGRVPVSAALGELLADFRREHLQQMKGLSHAKVGLAGCAATTDWPSLWIDAMRGLPENARPVAVAYADWQIARSPPAEQLLPIAARLNCPYLLVDTFDKSNGRLLDHITMDELVALGREATQFRMRLVLAGSLDEGSIRRLAPLAPAYFAVRGAVTGGDRTQAIASARVKRLVEVVRTSVARVARASQEVA